MLKRASDDVLLTFLISKKMNKSKTRINRSNSFELSDTEQQSPSNLKSNIFELQSFFPTEADDFTEIDRLIDESKQEANDDDQEFQAISLYKVKFVKNVRKDMRCLEVFKSIRSLMEDVRKNAEVTNWDLIVKDGFKVQCYHSFIYTLIRMIELNSDDRINRDLAFNAGRTYFCLLGLPGAKRCLIWDSDLVMTYFKLFSLHDRVNNHSSFNDYNDHYLEIQIIQMLSECKNVFNIVCLSDQGEVMEKYIETLSGTLEHFMKSARNSSHDIIMQCYENLEALCLKPLPDKDIEGILYLIFCLTVDLHFVAQKRNNRTSSMTKHGESISDFFLYLLSNYSDKTKNVLLKFIKSLLSNPDHKFEREKHQKLLDVAVKYELAIFWTCKESLVDYLNQLALAADHRQRLNCVEFSGKMLQINSTPDHNQQHLKVDIPREASVIKILFEKVYDKQDNVKLKALSSLKAAMINGNDYCKKIFSVVFSPGSMDDNPEIMQILGEEAVKFHNSLLTLLQTCTGTYIKKTCLEILGKFKWR